MILGDAFIRIRPETQGFEKELQGTVGTAGSKVAKTLAATIGSAFVLTKIKSFAQAGLAELKEAAAVQAQTEAAIRSTGGAANVTSAQVGELAGNLLKISGVDDELIQKGANLLLTFTRVRNEVGEGNDIFNQATEAALDLSRAGFGSVESASVLLGKALNDPTVGLAALQRVGVRLSESQKELVASLEASGDVLGAQKVILEEVTKQVGGSAEAYGKTLPGQIDIATQSIDNMKGQMLAGLAPALTITAGATTFLTEQFAKQPQALQAVEGGLILTIGALGSIIVPLKSAIDLWRSFGGAAETAAAATNAASFQNSAASVDGLYASTGRATGGVSRLGTAAVNTGLVIGTLVGTFALLGDQADRLDLNKLEQDLLDLGEAGAATTLPDNLSDIQGAVEQITRPSVASQIENFSGSLNRAFGDTNDDLSQSRALIDDLDLALSSLAQRDPASAAAALDAITSSLSPRDAEALIGLLDDYDSTLAGIDVNSRTAASGVGEFGTAAADTAVPTEDLTRSTEDLAEAWRESTEEAQQANEAIEALFDTTQSSIDTQFAYRDSLDTTEDALQTLTDLQNEGKGGTEEYTRAVNDAEEALYAQSEAALAAITEQAELAGGTISAADAARIQIVELERLRDNVGPNTELGKRLQGHIDTLGRIPAEADTTVNVLTAQALADAEEFARRLREIIPAVRDVDAPFGWRLSRFGGAAGGLVPGDLRKFAGGGFVGTDTIPALLTPGEFISTASTVDRLGVDFFRALNDGAIPGVQVAQQVMESNPLVQNIYTVDPIAAASEAARRHRAVRLALTLR